MKLYIYDHCPFSARVRYVAGMLNLSLDVVTLAYDDDTTTKTSSAASKCLCLSQHWKRHGGKSRHHRLSTRLSRFGRKQYPISRCVEMQKDAFLPLQKIGYPRWTTLPLKEFSTASAKQAWRSKKETYELNFNSLLGDTQNIASQAEGLISEATALLKLGTGNRRKLVDEAIIFSILRGFFSAPEVLWDSSIANWMVTQSHTTQIKLLNDEHYQ